ncbi:MAG: TonB-dependent receptor [Gemmatimonadaceae bacterium]
MLALLLTGSAVGAQAPGATVAGRVLDAATAMPVFGAQVRVEGLTMVALTDSAGRYRIIGVPAGPRVMRALRLGYAPTRSPVVVPSAGTLALDLQLARSALSIAGVTVTADPLGRASGETGTATVIGREAIRNQVAASLAGVLELVPGVPLQPPGLDGVQQFSLRAIPLGGGDVTNRGVGAQTLASMGTLVVLDGVPLTNDANLQSLGRRGELSFSSSAGGGIDLRRIPASTLERVEVLRGVASARWGDLTQGAVIVETRAGRVAPEAAVRYDARTMEASLVGGTALPGDQLVTATLDAARTRLSPGTSREVAERLATQLAWRAERGSVPERPDGAGLAPLSATGLSAVGTTARLVLDGRADLYVLRQSDPLSELTGRTQSRSSDRGGRVSMRARLRYAAADALELTASAERTEQHGYTAMEAGRGSLPFTHLMEPGRAVGHFVGGSYLAEATVDGAATNAYTRLEATMPRRWLGTEHGVRVGGELRRVWNSGAGYQFDPELPPQTTFNGVNGFDRPRPFGDVRPMATSAVYVDDRLNIPLPGDADATLQLGLRADVLHGGGSWFSTVRDVVVQPRANLELAPLPWLRLHAGAGRFSKSPTIGQLSPAPQWFDVVNVNWYADDPAERLAVLTTFRRDTDNPDLGFSVADKGELGLELVGGGAAVAVTFFADRITDGVGDVARPDFLLRDHYALADSTLGTGRPPTIVEPPASTDTVPIIVHRPANNLTLRSKGVEVTASLPEIPLLRTRVVLQGAWLQSRMEGETVELDRILLDVIQGDPRTTRTPYWQSLSRRGRRGVATARLVHQQPEVGLVVTGTVQYNVAEYTYSVGPSDSLSFAGYLTRDGTLVPVPEGDRGQAQYQDLQLARRGVLRTGQPVPDDWMMSLQVSKSLPADGRLSFYAFNALDRVGRFVEDGGSRRLWPATRFGLEVTIPLGFVRGLK